MLGGRGEDARVPRHGNAEEGAHRRGERRGTMSDCTLMRENMPLLLTESLDPARRETAHQHIEQCAACGAEWAGYRETWNLLETVPELDVPARVKQQFMNVVNPQAETSNIVPFTRRPAFRWLAQAAAV